MSEFSALFEMARRKAEKAAKINAAGGETVKDFKKQEKKSSSGIGQDIFSGAIAAMEKKKTEMQTAEAVNIIKSSIESRLEKNSAAQMTSFNRNKNASPKVAGNTAATTALPVQITTPPPKEDILKHFLSKGMEYMKACPIPDALMGKDSIEKSLTGYLAENSIKIGSKALGELMTLYSGYSDLEMVDRGLVRAAIGYIFSSGTMVPHNTPNIGFADDRIVISYVTEKLRGKLTTNAVQKGEKLREEIKAMAKGENKTISGTKQLDVFLNKTKTPQNSKPDTTTSADSGAPAKERPKIVTSFG